MRPATHLMQPDMPVGSVGAGTGATVAKAFGIEGAVKGGIGSACCVLPDGVSVGAAVAVNAWGGILRSS